MHGVTVFAAGLLAVAVQAQSEEAPQPIAPEAIARAVEQLGDPKFAVREQATTLLWRAGAAAEQPLRAALTGSTTSPPIFEVMEVLGRDETLARLADAAGLTVAASQQIVN